ncbi:MAG: TolC family protein [Gammaproteobacteria bacterium]|nr:TolC family protein [Gammaproteobacteria bacterium]
MKILKARQLAVWVVAIASAGFVMPSIGADAKDLSTEIMALSGAVNASLEVNPRMVALKAELQSARAALRAADQALFNPELELEYENIDVLDSTTQTLGINQTLDWGDQRGSRTSVAKAELDKVTAAYQYTSQLLISELLSLQANYQTRAELKALSDETLKLMKDFRRIAEVRYKAGDLTQVEYNLSQLAYHQAIMQQANALSNATEAQEQLRVLSGEQTQHLPSLPEKLPQPAIEGELDTFLYTLPLVKAQLAESKLARHQVELRKSETAWNPTLGVRAGKEEDESLIGLTLSIPLNIRNNFRAEVDAAQQNAIAIEQHAHMAFRETRARIIATTERYRNLLKTWNTWRSSSQISVEQQLSLIRKLWRAGDISASDYLLQLKQALEIRATGLELRNKLWLVAFEWMSLTDQLDDWLGLEIELPGKN